MVKLTLLGLVKVLLIMSTLSCYLLLRHAMQDKPAHVVQWIERSVKSVDMPMQRNFDEQLLPSCTSGNELGVPPFVRFVEVSFFFLKLFT